MRKKLGMRLLAIAAAGVSLTLLQTTGAYAETIHQGPWSLTGPAGSSASSKTPMYTSANGTVYTCVIAKTFSGDTEFGAGWSFKLFWYNGGHPSLLWQSPKYTDEKNHCSGQITVAVSNPKFYDVITVTGGQAGDFAQASGLWDLYVDYTCPVCTPISHGGT